MESFIDHSEVENEVGEDFGQTECDSVENAEHRAPRIHNPKNSKENVIANHGDSIEISPDDEVRPWEIFSSVREWFTSCISYLDDELEYKPEVYEGIWKHLHLLKVLSLYLLIFLIPFCIGSKAYGGILGPPPWPFR